ncbi:MAG TPA: hypothetical protein PLV68_00625, partial [Ilumatobacteraceae bacterium]|nr:hypothetical protein [Ilumatobacteraceae bacterium]
MGIAMATGTTTIALRSAHEAVNVLGLVGLVIGSTMPYFAATVGRSKMSPLARRGVLTGVIAAMASGIAITAASLAADAPTIAAAGLMVYALSIGGVVRVLPSLTRRQMRWAGPRLLALWTGAAWWIVGVVAVSADLAAGDPPFAQRWLLVIVLGGYVQILWGSLAYLLPMLRGGGPDHLSAGFATTRSWIGFGAANLTALAIATALPRSVSYATGAVWALDTAWRLGRVGTRRADRPQSGA